MKISILTAWLLVMMSIGNCYQLNVGNGTEHNQHLPCDPFYNHSGSQLIYDRNYFPYNGTITQLSFQYQFTTTTPETIINDVTLMMGEAPTNFYQNEEDFIALNQLELCYSGNLTADNFQASNSTGSGWMTIDLTQAYSYSGNGNLIVFFMENHTNSGLNSDNFLAFSTSGNTSMCFVDLENPLDPGNLVTPIFIRNWLPNTIFDIAIDQNYPQAIYPTDNAIDIETSTGLQINVLQPNNTSISFACPENVFTIDILDNYQHLHDYVYEIYPQLPFAPNTPYEWQVHYNNGVDIYDSDEFSFETSDDEHDLYFASLENNTYSVSLEWNSIYDNQYPYVVYRNNEEIVNQYENSFLDNQVCVGESYDYQVKFYYIDGSYLETEIYNIEIGAVENIIIDEEFENYESFTSDLGDWINIDNDGSATYILSNYFYPNAGSEAGFVVFEPGAVTPPLELNIAGDKCLVSFSSITPPTSDILISPSFQADQVGIDIYLKSLNTSWGMERVKCGVVYNNNQEDIIYFQEGNYIEIPGEMTHLNFSHTCENSQDRITNVWLESCGIQTLMLVIDRIVISSSPTSNEEFSQVVHEPVIFPNPVRNGSFQVGDIRGETQVKIYNLKGQLIHKEKVLNPEHQVKLPKNTPNGIYFVKLKSDNKDVIKKISIIRVKPE